MGRLCYPNHYSYNDHDGSWLDLIIVQKNENQIHHTSNVVVVLFHLLQSSNIHPSDLMHFWIANLLLDKDNPVQFVLTNRIHLTRVTHPLDSNCSPLPEE